MSETTRTVGRFEIVRRIGRGGMAVVHLAHQPGLDRWVALKELVSFASENDPVLVERFLREARLAGALNHPNIVTVYDYFEDDGTPYIAMEYLERGSLRPHVGRLTTEQSAGVLEGLLAGLAHVERRGVIHRDLKPENLLVTSEGRVKVADLGIAKAYNTVSFGLTSTGLAIGTPAYMAPEQALAQEVTPRTDLYATGVIAYELFVGRLPFEQTDTPLAVLWKHVNEPPPPPRSLRPDLDPRLAAWIERLLAKAPADRPASAGDAWHELEEIVVDAVGWRWRQRAALPESPVEASEAATSAESPAFTSAPHQALAPTRPASAPTPPTLAPPTAPPILADTPATEVAPRPTWAWPRTSRRGVVVGTALAGLAIAALAGVLSGRAAGGDERVVTAKLVPVEAPGLRIGIPSSWQVRPPVRVTGLPLQDAVAVGPIGDGTVLVAGEIAASAPDFLPAGLAKRLESAPPAELVKLGGTTAFRYAGLRTRGSDGPLTLFVVPRSPSSATAVACVRPAARGACEGVAATLALPAGATFPVVPTVADREALTLRLRLLAGERATALTRLRRAKTRSAQARAAAEVAAVYRRAARAMPKGVSGPARSVAAAAAAAASAYAGLARAAGAGDEKGYGRAARAVARREAELVRRVDALTQIGFVVT